MKDSTKAVFDLLPKNGLKLSGSQVKATLELEDEEYKAAKAELKEAGLVVLGRGRSGTISVTEIDPDAPDVLPEIAQIGAAASANLWAETKERAKHHNCQCDLVPNMTYEELIELGAGCTGTEARMQKYGTMIAGSIGGYVCPALDYYRRGMYKFRKNKDKDEDFEAII